jgi:hypothetical protein
MTHRGPLHCPGGTHFCPGQRQPSITAVASNKVDLLFQYVSMAQIYKQRFDGSSCSAPSYAGSGRYPSVSVGKTSARYVWTSGSTAPYAIQMSSETLNKPSEGAKDSCSRSVAWLNDEGDFLEVRVKPVRVRLLDGEEQALGFAIGSLDSFELTPNT